jgi:hypothetical protein
MSACSLKRSDVPLARVYLVLDALAVQDYAPVKGERMTMWLDKRAGNVKTNDASLTGPCRCGERFAAAS